MAPTTTDALRVPAPRAIPEQVRTLVAHEPPLFELLPDRDRFRVVVRNVEEAFVEKGTEAAGHVLAAGLPMSGGRQENGGKVSR